MSQRVCFYFQVHQPYRLRDIRITDIGSSAEEYFDDKLNKQIFRKVAEKCYLPTNALILELLKAHPEFHVSYSLSGVFLDQCREYGPDVLKSFQALAATGQVEFLAETYYHSLSAIASTEEFCEQVKKHVLTIRKLFKMTPRVFRNTELIFSNHIANMVREMGFDAILAEGADRVLNGTNPNDIHVPVQFQLPQETRDTIRRLNPTRRQPRENIAVLLKNYSLSDDVAFRFSDKNWTSHPLSVETYSDWIQKNSGHCVNLFMDYETFGEHQWAASGIFEFLRHLPAEWKRRGIATVTPSQSLDSWNKDWQMPLYDAHGIVSWADTERDLSAWQGNPIQDSSLQAVFRLEKAVKETHNHEIIETWRKLLTSDHFYYMCTKFWHDGDVHKYFSPYDSPYEAFRRYSHAVEDLKLVLAKTTNDKELVASSK